MKLYRIEAAFGILRVSWIMDEGEGFKQSHVDIQQPASEQKIELVSNVLESMGFELSENFDAVSDIILEKAGVKTGS